MKTLRQVKWFVKWEDVFGQRLDGGTVHRWEDFFERGSPGCTAAEIDKAIDDVAEQVREGQIRFRPTCNHVVGAINHRRHLTRKKLARERGYVLDPEQTLARKRRIKVAASPGEIWDIILEPHDINEMFELERYAKSLPGGFERPARTACQGGAA